MEKAILDEFDVVFIRESGVDVLEEVCIDEME